MSDDEASRVRTHALAALARREHSKLELVRKLKSRGFAAETVAGVLDDLETTRLQSDTRHAEAYTRSRAERGYGPQRIAAELKARGSDTELIHRGLADFDTEWVARARQADRKKFGIHPDHSFAALAKRRRFLEYRGFTAEQINDALKIDSDLD